MAAIINQDIADLNETLVLLQMHYQDSVHTTQLQGLYEQDRLSKILAVRLEQQKSELDLRLMEQESEATRLHLDIKRLEVALKNITKENTKLQSDLTLGEKRYTALEQLKEAVEKKGADAREECVKATVAVVESQKRANEVTHENLKMIKEIQTLNDMIKGLTEDVNARDKATIERASLAEKKSTDLEKRLQAAEDGTNKIEKENAALKKHNKELESRCKDLEKKLLETESDSLRERNATRRTEKKELRDLEKQHGDEITELTAKLTKQTALTEKAEKELANVKEQSRTKLAVLEKKLQTAQSKIKSTTGNRGKSATIEALPPALLFTPEPDRRQPQNVRSRANAAPDKLLEKSTFSMTPFLNRQASVMPLSPVDTNRQDEKSTEWLVESATDESTETTSRTDSDYVEPAKKQNESKVRVSKPDQSRRSTSTAASLAALVSEELGNSTSAVQPKKKKRRLGASRGPTLFDEAEGTLETEPKKGRLDVAAGTKMAVPVAQRAFLGAKTISPLKKRNEKLRDMFKLS
ncbi:hypothetical protein V1517DRAFT_4936 [Lipomyces orientalis]|uniref:Uncharacterized protein n=1 Tax=Lipomyces orientalis TaxID=1233043 RepID=A0ACC3TWG3_9ASCO